MNQQLTDTRINLLWWNERAAQHRQTPLYQTHIKRLENGGLALLPLEVQELGEIRGQNVLHVQCHIGTDTLSLARLGAHVTGIDFSEAAISEAQNLAQDLGIRAHFETCEISELAHRYSGHFDLVFASLFLLKWLHDLNGWAKQLAACLSPGGRVYLSDSHPLVWALADHDPIRGNELVLGYPYLAQDAPSAFVEAGSYADRTLPTTANETREWSWGLGDVVNAIIGAGLTLEFLNEHTVGFYPAIADCVAGADGHYRLPEALDGRYPLTFSLSARKR